MPGEYTGRSRRVGKRVERASDIDSERQRVRDRERRSEDVEKRRGLGMFVKPGARNLLLRGEREKFLAEDWPRIAATIERLGLTQKELEAAAKRASSKSAKEER